MSSGECDPKHTFIVETDLENPRTALERARAMAGVRGEIIMAFTNVGEKRWEVSFSADRYCNFMRILNVASGITVINDDKL
jgi:hypothetical protein